MGLIEVKLNLFDAIIKGSFLSDSASLWDFEWNVLKDICHEWNLKLKHGLMVNSIGKLFFFKSDEY